MKRILRRADDVLRGRSASNPWGLVLTCGLAYGAVMGLYEGRAWQVIFSSIKVPLLLLATFALSLPSYFVINTLMGVRSDFPEAVRAIVVSEATLTIILASLAPLTLFWYASSTGYHAAILFNGAMFAGSSLAAQIVLVRGYRPLIARSSRHRILLWTWMIIHAFVGIQMGWSLRPFIGSSGVPTQFFRRGGDENAYLLIGRMILGSWSD